MEEGLYFEEYDQDWSFASAAVEVTDAMIGTFVQLCGFTSPTFTDRSYVDRNYAGRMAPGVFVLSLAEGLVLNAGLTRRRGIFLMELTPRFLKPTYAGDNITNHVVLESKRQSSRPDRGIVITRHAVRNQKGDEVISYRSTRMIRTRAFVEPV
ncbi:MAG: MaoC family dehydratase N-terminal domain-containing protein [Burkholderiaceae bacterium]